MLIFCVRLFPPKKKTFRISFGLLCFLVEKATKSTHDGYFLMHENSFLCISNFEIQKTSNSSSIFSFAPCTNSTYFFLTKRHCQYLHGDTNFNPYHNASGSMKILLWIFNISYSVHNTDLRQKKLSLVLPIRTLANVQVLR